MKPLFIARGKNVIFEIFFDIFPLSILSDTLFFLLLPHLINTLNRVCPIFVFKKQFFTF